MTKHNLDECDLVIFGDFGVLTTTPFREPDGRLLMLDGRLELLNALRGDRAARHLPVLRYAIASNKGGVAIGIQSEAQARAELEWTAQQIGAAATAICFALERTAQGLEHYATPQELARRKPAPRMLEELIGKLGVERSRVLVVGNYADDCKAARAAGLAWETTYVFFARRAADLAPAEDLGPLEDFDLVGESEEGSQNA